MAIANLQTQIANLTSQLSQYIERTTIPRAPAYGVQGYQAHERPQRGWESDNTWSDHSNTMWWEPQQAQHDAYWQPYEEFYSSPVEPPQPNSGPMDCNQILDELISLTQGSQNQANKVQQEEYW